MSPGGRRALLVLVSVVGVALVFGLAYMLPTVLRDETVSAGSDTTTAAPTTDATAVPPASEGETTASTPPAVTKSSVPKVPPRSLALDLKGRWQVVPEQTTQARTVYVDTVQCGSISYATQCPGFAVVNTDAAVDEMPYGDRSTPVDGCYWNGLHDNTYYGEPSVVGVTTIGGLEAQHATQQFCAPPDLPQASELLHSWFVEETGVLVFETYMNYGDQAPDPSADFQEFIAGAGWK